ncbi:MAG: flagellin [Pseudomonadota bacterium]
MLTAPITDLALDLRQSQQALDIRTRLQEAGFEMTLGRTANYAESLRGNVSELYEIDRSIALLAQHSISLTLASNRAAATQFALENVLGTVGEIGIQIEGAVLTDDLVQAEQFAQATNQLLESVVGSLNTNYGGRYVFAGAAETTKPLEDAETIIGDIITIMDAGPDTATALANIDIYFDDPAGITDTVAFPTAPFGYQTTIYNGSTTDAPGVLTPDGDRIDYMIRADDQAIRDMIKGLATAAAFNQSTITALPGAADAILLTASAGLQAAGDDLIALRSTLGNAEENIETTSIFVEAETATLELARFDLVGVDQYEATTRFANLENQLTSLYTVTARLSNLSFTNFLR